MKSIGILRYTIRSEAKAGFSLTELAIVLAVVGIIIGGIWSFASQGREKSRQLQLKEDILIVVKNVRAYGASLNGITGWVTPQLTSLNPSAIPGDMLRTAGGCAVAGPASCADHPWGPKSAGANAAGSFNVCAWDVSASPPVCSNVSQQFFAVQLDDMPLDSCINAVLGNSGADAPPGLYDVVINTVSIINGAGVTHQLPVKLADAKTLCTNASKIDIVYRLATPQS
jgi:prepilin-type N-terminal cleavage/methylation domain-containing protein